MAEYITTEIQIAQKVNAAFAAFEKTIDDKDFWGFVKGLPSMIVQEGILQTLAFLKAKKETKDQKKYHKIFNAFNEYAKELLGDQSNDFNLINCLINNSIELEKYLYLEEQMLQFAIWFKRIGLAIKAPENCK